MVLVTATLPPIGTGLPEAFVMTAGIAFAGVLVIAVGTEVVLVMTTGVPEAIAGRFPIAYVAMMADTIDILVYRLNDFM